ncbi:FolC bifunctional protein [Beutenbergia cavernae DSM 12333]|uniref:tetrahydrofolate synthase n=1 Tax=Beutenbergia cavernae (strain ATCC BAA-8 / DSM 12333 / CCUG 43141 / JCM 11478 / NBRC 16432 / NCIMB 13614 / HKI 0122) TaxID=471853 RepID=C5BXC9_BEUC1|nr:folylpolyglutamate synthase/dihydrofolate synthase family protein [Beutenbergia cavernae]ACQ80812.1 FolC bifunctional protein [Beutenbergia cavernae DSM 12333]
MTREVGPPSPVDGPANARAQEIYHEILRRTPEHDFDPTIERVRRVISLLGDPQQSFRAIHLTGTNGKTSTARMTERLLRELGLRTGRFTSPHLSTVRERIAIDGEPISAARWVEVWDDVAPYIAMVDAELEAAGQSRLSFFEVLTSMAYAAFADAPVDVAVVEVGMGGEWDSTNVVDAEVAVVTPIAMDHERWLGHDLASIATVKSGIIKDGATCVSAAQAPEVTDVLAAAAARHRARLVVEAAFGDAADEDAQATPGEIAVLDRRVAVGGQLVTLQGIGGVYEDVFVPLHGAHQAHNALLALAAVEAFLGGVPLAADVVETAFADVTSPGRMELVRTSPAVIVDAAHNPAGAHAAVEAIEEAFGFSRLVGVVGIMADKDAAGILTELEPVLAEVVITRSTSLRSMDVEELAEIARDIFGEDRVRVAEQLPDAVALAAELAESGDEMPGIGVGTGVVAFGSVILAAEVRTLFGAAAP